MKIIAIDGYEANQKHRVGIGRYAYEILTRMYEQVKKSGDTSVSFRIYLPDRPLGDMPKETDWWKYRVTGPKKFWTFIGLPFALSVDSPKADIVFSPTHYIPRFTSIPRVMSIMDLSYLSYPELFRKKDLHQLVHWTAYSAAHAAKIFTISEYSRNDIIKTYHKRASDVIVTYPGLNAGNTPIPTQHRMEPKKRTRKPSATVAGLMKKYGISRHYILSVGTLQPRKNYSKLIQAYAVFLKKNKQNFGEIDLVIVGKKGWLYEDILSAPKRYGVEGKVKFLQFVPDEDLPALYSNALCFALPSLYEGFGLPVLEAMAYSCPVVVSDVSSLPEIAGKAGVYVSPTDSNDIAHGLLAAVRERNLMQGRLRIKRGLEQVAKFSWDKAAAETLEVLKHLK